MKLSFESLSKRQFVQNINVKLKIKEALIKWNFNFKMFNKYLPSPTSTTLISSSSFGFVDSLLEIMEKFI